MQKIPQVKVLTETQQIAINRLYEDNTLLVGEMGCGKTIIALTAINELIMNGVLGEVLIVAPLKVCETVWRQEAAAWDHTRHLRVGICTGSETERDHVLSEEHDIVVINFENLAWLFDTWKREHGFDGLVVDELSRFKSGGQAFKKLRTRLKDFKWRVGMTGTPVSEDWQGLFYQLMTVDGGACLGTRKDAYLTRYFYPLDRNQYRWGMKKGAAKSITKRIKKRVHVLPDYTHTLPELRLHEVVVTLPKNARGVYTQLCRDMLVETQGTEIAAANAAVLSGKLLQAANGFLYDTEGDKTVIIHKEKIKAVSELVEAIEGSVVVVYWYKADLERLKALYPDADVLGEGDVKRIVGRWNLGGAPILLLHPRSGAHGLHLAMGGCHMIWLGPVWSRDLHEQTLARLWRQGQLNPVTVFTIVAKDTIDRLVIERVEGKGEYHQLLIAHLHATQ